MRDVLRVFGNDVFSMDLSNVKCINSIFQLSDMPDKVIDGEGDCYIGYEEIGEGYSGKLRLENSDLSNMSGSFSFN